MQNSYKMTTTQEGTTDKCCGSYLIGTHYSAAANKNEVKWKQVADITVSIASE